MPQSDGLFGHCVSESCRSWSVNDRKVPETTPDAFVFSGDNS